MRHTRVTDPLSWLVEDDQDPFLPGVSAIPVSGKVVGVPEKKRMVEAVLDGWLTAGRFNQAFEAALGKFIDTRHVLTVNSGSSANLVAFYALTSPELGKRAIKPGDEVITVAAGFPTTITPILQYGAVPVFVDVDATTWNADTTALSKAISSKTKAVVLAHTLGNPFAVDAVKLFCDEHKLWLIEDCCDALGSLWGEKHVGTFGDIATLSFYPAHHITTGEGGAVFTDNPLLAQLVESFRDWGRHCRCRTGEDNRCGRRFDGQYGDLPEGYDHKYVYSHAGFNLKITDIQAACGLAQMDRLPGFIAARKHNYACLYNRLESCTYLQPAVALEQSSPSWFGFPILLSESSPINRLDLLKHLDKNKIGTRLLFAGNATKQPFMQGRAYRIVGELNNTDALMNRAFWIGTYPGLTLEMLEYTADTLISIFGR